MKKLTYIFLLVWNIGIGQEEKTISSLIWIVDTIDLHTVSISDKDSGENDLKDSGIKWDIDDSAVIPKNLYKYDTVKAVFMLSDSADEVVTKFLRTGEEVIAGIRDYSDRYLYWTYGYIVNSIDYVYTSASEGQGFIRKPIKTPIGYLDLNRQPFSKDFIIWDYKIVE